ncbi:MAG: glycosyltransferase [Chitinophagaceae bacterium]|nr:glycosyltransferase [Chitinophagaceae bacterium]MDP3667455.1 glycosyltransferase [Sediminibacterium sp.]
MPLINREISILFVGMVSVYNGNSTSNHRYKALTDIGYRVDFLDTTGDSNRYFSNLFYRICNKLFNLGIPVLLPDIERNNVRLIEKISGNPYDLIWIEKNILLNSETFDRIRLIRPKIKIIGFSPDDMNARHNQSANFLKSLSKYDCFITTKSYNVQELLALGSPKAFFVNNGYDPDTFHPIENFQPKPDWNGNDICFIGTYEYDRAMYLYFLAEKGLIVNVFGNDWKKFPKAHKNLVLHFHPLYGEDFAMACSYFRINLCFLRKMNRDLQTTRSIEIPGSGGFMLAERSVEHEMLFSEGYEASYFSSEEELFNKCVYYLKHEEERVLIAYRGLKKCKNSGYSNAHRIKRALDEILPEMDLVH